MGRMFIKPKKRLLLHFRALLKSVFLCGLIWKYITDATNYLSQLEKADNIVSHWYMRIHSHGFNMLSTAIIGVGRLFTDKHKTQYHRLVVLSPHAALKEGYISQRQVKFSLRNNMMVSKTKTKNIQKFRPKGGSSLWIWNSEKSR